MRTRLWVFCGFLILLFGLKAYGEEPKLQTMGQYTRLQFPAAGGSSFRLVNGEKDATVTLSRVRPGSLGAANSWSDGRVQSVSVRETGLDQVEIQVKFNDPATESFVYLQGGMLVMDLWQGSKKNAVVSPVAETPQPVAAKPVKVAKKPSADPRRAIASVSDHGKRPDESENHPVASAIKPLHRDVDLFQRFNLPMPPLVIESKGKGFDLPPKANIEELWTLSNGDKKTDEGAAFEFAKKLFAEKKYGLALKTMEIEWREHPKSPHTAEMHFLEALCYRRLGEETGTASLSEKSESILEELGSKLDADGNPMPFQRAIRLYFAQKEYLKENWLKAIQHLEFVVTASPEGDSELPLVQIMLAEAYVKVNQPRRAERIYRFLFEHFSKHIVAKESRYRIADLLALEKNYNRVTDEGEGALAAFPEYEKNRSEVLFEMGEANFWLGNYARAEKYFRRFTDISSAQTNSALAWVRIGEITELTRGDLKAARESYFRAKNGYPFSQGDLVATVRLARIDLGREKEPTFVVKTLKDMLADKTIDGELRRMAELTLVDYLVITDAVDEAIPIAQAGLGQTDGKAYEGYKRAYTNALFAKLQWLNKQKIFAEALALYNKERKWLDLRGADTLKTMAEVYRGLRLYDTANELMAAYGRKIRGGRGLASRAREEEISIARAKNSFARGAYAETLEHLPEEKEAPILAMRAISEFRLGRVRVAYGFATQAVALAKANELSDSTLVDVAEVLIAFDDQEREFPRMEKDLRAVAELLVKDSERIAYAIGDSLWYQKRHGEAVEAYQAALEKFPKGERANRAKYNMGISYLGIGKKEEAVRVLTELAGSGGGLWAESAKQELELVKWEKKYSSVLRTLPPSGLGITN